MLYLFLLVEETLLYSNQLCWSLHCNDSAKISQYFFPDTSIFCAEKKNIFSILARTSPLLSPPGVVVVDSRPPSNDSCADFCFKHETRYSWYDLRGKARHSDAFRASLVRAHFSLQSSNRNCLVKSYLGQIEVIYVYLSIPHRISFFIHLFDYLSWLSNGIESAPWSSSIWTADLRISKKT